MPGTVIVDALAIWRDAERLLDAVPPESADRESVELALDAAREVYHSLSASTDVSQVQLASARMTIATARRALDRVREPSP